MPKYEIDVREVQEPKNSGPGCGTIIFWGAVLILLAELCGK